MQEKQVAPEAKVETTPLVEVKTEMPAVTEPLASEPAKVEITEPPKVVAVAPVVSPILASNRPELDPTKSHKERIAAFLEAKKGTGTIKLNDFLKSLFPIPKGPGAPGHTDQGAMRKLRQDLREMKNAGEIRLVNDSYERLGDAHFPDEKTGKTHYWDVATLPIEAVL